jgi:hypothetical protein
LITVSSLAQRYMPIIAKHNWPLLRGYVCEAERIVMLVEAMDLPRKIGWIRRNVRPKGYAVYYLCILSVRAGVGEK